MSRKQAPKGKALIEKMANLPWKEYPGHFGGALSKALAAPENTGSSRLDFRISRYAPAAYVGEHVHQVQELFTVFDRLRGQVSIVIVEHNLDLVLALADRVFALERGAVFHAGPAQPLLDDLDYRKQILWL